jgi:hypothetical protein
VKPCQQQKFAGGYRFSGSVSIVKGGGVQATYSVGSVRKNLNHLPSHAVTKEINRVLSWANLIQSNLNLFSQEAF